MTALGCVARASKDDGTLILDGEVGESFFPLNRAGDSSFDDGFHSVQESVGRRRRLRRESSIFFKKTLYFEIRI